MREGCGGGNGEHLRGTGDLIFLLKGDDMFIYHDAQEEERIIPLL